MAVLAVVLAALGAPLAGATADEAGLPLFSSSRGRDLARGGGHVDPQMFGFAQDRHGLLYVANGAGVLVFDGARWQSVPAAAGATVLSVAVAPDDTVWLGASGGFGRLITPPGGEPAYEAVDTLLADEPREVGDVWDTIHHDGAAYFRTPQALYRWRDGSVETFRPRGRGFGVARKIGDRLYLRDAGAGLFVMEEHGPVLAPDGDLLAELAFGVLLPLDHGRLLVGTRSQGLYVYDPAPALPRSDRLRPFESPAAAWLAEHQLYSGTALPDGRLVLGTLRGGALLLEPGGRARWQLGRRQGLADDTVLAAFADRDDGVWLGFNDGLTLVETGSGLAHHGEASGLVGFVEAVQRSQGRLYVATGFGVMRMETEGAPHGAPSFAPVSGLADQAWTLLDEGEVLLAGNEQGVFEVRGLSARRLLDGETYTLVRGERAGRVWAGRTDGAAWLQRLPGGGWATGRIAGVESVVRSVVELPRGVLWLGTEHGDLLRVDLTDEGDDRPPSVRPYGEAQGLQERTAHPMRFGNGLLVGAGGLFAWDPESDRFAPDPRFPAALAREHGASLCPLPDGSVILSAGHRVRLLMRRGDAYEPAPSIVDRVPLGNRLISCLVEDPVVWLGTDDGLFRWDRAWQPARSAPPAALVRRVRHGDATVAAVVAPDGRPTHRLPWRRTPLRVELALPSFPAADRNEYRTRLEGFEQAWTPWSREPWRELTNLPPGRYRLRVQARDVRGEEAAETALELDIAPPWYRSTFAYLGYGAFAAAALFGGGQLQVRKVRRRNRELQHLVAERTEELRAASITDPLTGLHNRRFFVEVISAEVAAVKRTRRRDHDGEAHELVFCLIDLDHFKAVNDRFGHAAGDEVLRQAADRLRAASREGDLLFRWGGEELLLLARDTRRDGAAELAKRLLGAVGGDPVAIPAAAGAPGHPAPARPWRLTCSIGFTALPLFAEAADAASLDHTLRFADAALYEAKRAGRNRACGVLPALPFAVVRERWPGWRDHTLAEAAAGWLTLVVVAGPSEATASDGSAA